MTNIDNFFNVGTIVNTHGIRGEVKIMAITDFAEERFQKGASLFIDTKQGRVPVTVTSSRLHKNAWLVLFDGVSIIMMRSLIVRLLTYQAIISVSLKRL